MSCCWKSVKFFNTCHVMSDEVLKSVDHNLLSFHVMHGKLKSPCESGESMMLAMRTQGCWQIVLELVVGHGK